MIITESQIKEILRNTLCEMLDEVKVKKDRFDQVAKWLTFDSPDQFYFVSIMKRKKDNPGCTWQRHGNPNYGGGAWYLKQYRIYSPQDLFKYKDEIIDICNKNNARACITINPRSTAYFDNEIQKMNATQPGRNWDAILPARVSRYNRTKDGQRALVDIDLKNKLVYDAALGICARMGVKIVDHDTTASGGAHIVVLLDDDSKFPAFNKEINDLNGKGRKFSKRAAVGVDRDAFDNLYSNVETAGY